MYMTQLIINTAALQCMYIPANFFRDIGVRFYPGSAKIFEDHTIISEDSRWSPKSSEESRVFRKRPKS